MASSPLKVVLYSQVRDLRHCTAWGLSEGVVACVVPTNMITGNLLKIALLTLPAITVFARRGQQCKV